MKENNLPDQMPQIGKKQSSIIFQSYEKSGKSSPVVTFTYGKNQKHNMKKENQSRHQYLIRSPRLATSNHKNLTTFKYTEKSENLKRYDEYKAKNTQLKIQTQRAYRQRQQREQQLCNKNCKKCLDSCCQGLKCIGVCLCYTCCTANNGDPPLCCLILCCFLQAFAQ